MSKTAIEWTSTWHADGCIAPGQTWTEGCDKVFYGCKFCYAEMMTRWLQGCLLIVPFHVGRVWILFIKVDKCLLCRSIERKMEANFVILAPMEEQNTSLQPSSDAMLNAARRYTVALEKAKQLLVTVEDRLLSGTPGTVYLKKRGHRPLSEEDLTSIIQNLGTDEDKDALNQFSKAQNDLSERLKKFKWIGLLIEQSGIPYLKARRRIAKPELWKPEEVIQIVEVLSRLQP